MSYSVIDGLALMSIRVYTHKRIVVLVIINAVCFVQVLTALVIA